MDLLSHTALHRGCCPFLPVHTAPISAESFFRNLCIAWFSLSSGLFLAFSTCSAGQDQPRMKPG